MPCINHPLVYTNPRQRARPCPRRRRWSNSSPHSPPPRGPKQVLTHTTQEYGGYITDITRTWPVSGAFAPAQKDLYEAILRVQRTCISLCRANASLSLEKLHNIAEEALRDQLKQLGFDMSGQVSRLTYLLDPQIMRFVEVALIQGCWLLLVRRRLSRRFSHTIWATISGWTCTIRLGIRARRR